MFSFIVEQWFSLLCYYIKLSIHDVMSKVNKGKKMATEEDSVYASMIFFYDATQVLVDELSLEQLTSLSIMIYYVMDNLYFPSRSIKPSNQPKFRFFLFFAFHHLKMVFIEIYSVITFSYPHPFSLPLLCLLLAMVVNSVFDVEGFLFATFWLRIKMSQKWCLFFHCSHIHCPCLEAHYELQLPSLPLGSKIYWPNYFSCFTKQVERWEQCKSEREWDTHIESGKFSNLFTYRWINTFMQIDGHKCKQKSHAVRVLS